MCKSSSHPTMDEVPNGAEKLGLSKNYNFKNFNENLMPFNFTNFLPKKWFLDCINSVNTFEQTTFLSCAVYSEPYRNFQFWIYTLLEYLAVCLNQPQKYKPFVCLKLIKIYFLQFQKNISKFLCETH